MFLQYNVYTICWAIIILSISLLPASKIPVIDFWDRLPFDKAVHIGMYTVFVFIMIVGFLKQYSISLLRHNAILSAIIISILYGSLVEVIQLVSVIGERTFEPLDLLANTMGCILGSLVFNVIYYRM